MQMERILSNGRSGSSMMLKRVKILPTISVTVLSASRKMIKPRPTCRQCSIKVVVREALSYERTTR